MLRKFIGTTLWLLATGVTAAIMLSAMGTQSYILSVIGLIGILAASTGVFLAMDAARDRAVIAFVLSLMLWVIGESFLLPSEFNFWSATVTARAEREADIQRQADGRRLILDRTAGRLAREKPARSAAEVQSAINEQLAKTFGKKATLNSLTKGCTDLDSPSIRFCRDVLSLRKELKTAEDYEKDSGLVWEANTRIDTNTSDAHGAHDGFMNAAKLFGGTPDQWALILTAVTMLLLLFTRGLSLYLGFRTPKRTPKRFDFDAILRKAEQEAKPVPVPEKKAEQIDLKPEKPASLEAEQIALPAPKQPKALNDNLAQIDPVEEEIKRIAKEIISGVSVSSGQAHKRVKAMCLTKGLKAPSPKAVTQKLDRTVASLRPGSRIMSSNKRRYSVVNVGRVGKDTANPIRAVA